MLFLRLCLSFTLVADFATTAAKVAPRHCRGSLKHLHLAVGRDPTTEMTVSFASTWSNPDISEEVPLGGVHIGTVPYDLDRFVGEQEAPAQYTAAQASDQNKDYYSPYQHHITIDALEPNTTYYYVAVLGNRTLGLDYLRDVPLRDHSSQHEGENLIAENQIVSEEELNDEEEESGRVLSLRRTSQRRLAPPPYDGSGKPCIEGHAVRSFKTAPITTTGPVTFAIIGDLGQFDHSQETLDHMREHRDGIDAVIMAGDIAYPEYDHRRWDTFFDFLDDYSIFDEVPLMVANGNHGE
jgi:hypothetical protein